MEENSGKIKITNENDRVTVAAILVKNGYTVSVKKIKVGNKYETFVAYKKDAIPTA